jgi:methionyl-tRNA formyltransferase
MADSQINQIAKINNCMELKIIFMGTPEFGATILENLIRNDLKPVLVITETDKPAGRKKIITPPIVKTAALRYNISIAQPKNISDSVCQIRDLKPDLIIVAAYGQIVPKIILEIPKFGCLNVHPSLLPKYRGPSPVQYAILNGDKETGVSIMLLDEKMDHGDVLSCASRQITGKETASILLKELTQIGAKLLVDTIPKWINNEIKPMPQDNTKATYTKILKKEDGKIDWTKPAEEIERQIRAFDPWPGCYTLCEDNKFNIKTIKIWKAGVQKSTKAGPFGNPGKTYMATNEKIAVQTGADFLIIEELQPESGKRMRAEEFLKGHSDFIGTILK